MKEQAKLYALKEQDFPQLFITEYQEIKASIENDIAEIELELLIAGYIEDHVECALATLNCVKKQYQILIEKSLN